MYLIDLAEFKEHFSVFNSDDVVEVYALDVHGVFLTHSVGGLLWADFFRRCCFADSSKTLSADFSAVVVIRSFVLCIFVLADAEIEFRGVGVGA